MKIDRRTLLGRLAFGAAAVLGAGMAAPKAEASELDQAPSFERGLGGFVLTGTGTRFEGVWTVSTGPGIGTSYDAPMGLYTRTAGYYYPRLTFEAMQDELTDNMVRATDPSWLTRWGQILAECPNAWPTNGEPPKALCAPGWCAPCDVWR